MNIYKMSRDELVAKAERDQAAIARAAGVLSDNAELQAKVRELRAELAAEKSKPAREVVRQVIKRVEVPGPERVAVKIERVEVPTPCPDQAAKIRDLETKLALFQKYDMTEFEKWRAMVDIVRGAK